MMNRIIVDAMGGDYAPRSEVEGGLLALKESINQNTALEITFIGDKDKIDEVLQKADTTNIASKITVIDAKEIISMHDDPIAALKTKKDSSMIRGISLLKDKEADGYVSAGNTGATLTVATMILGRINGVTRPTIGAFLPTSKKAPYCF